MIKTSSRPFPGVETHATDTPAHGDRPWNGAHPLDDARPATGEPAAGRAYCELCPDYLPAMFIAAMWLNSMLVPIGLPPPG